MLLKELAFIPPASLLLKSNNRLLLQHDCNSVLEKDKLNHCETYYYDDVVQVM